MMTRKDFTLIALAIREGVEKAETEEAVQAARRIACSMAVGLAASNPRFDARKFFESCGLV